MLLQWKEQHLSLVCVEKDKPQDQKFMNQEMKLQTNTEMNILQVIKTQVTLMLAEKIMEVTHPRTR